MCLPGLLEAPRRVLPPLDSAAFALRLLGGLPGIRFPIKLLAELHGDGHTELAAQRVLEALACSILCETFLPNRYPLQGTLCRSCSLATASSERIAGQKPRPLAASLRRRKVVIQGLFDVE